MTAGEQATFGRALLILSLGVALYGIAVAIDGTVRGGRRWLHSSCHAVFTLAGLLTVALAVIEAAFLRSDFHFALVAGHSSTTTPTLFRELRELELDWRTAKLSDADHDHTRQLREQAASLQPTPPGPEDTTSTNSGST